MPEMTFAGRGRVELAGGEIVEEEERLGALGQDVVGAHGDEVDADGLVQARGEGEHQLGAHSVRSRNEYGILEAGGLEIEEAAETAECAICARALGCSAVIGLIASTRASPASMSTPASLYVRGLSEGVGHAGQLPREIKVFQNSHETDLMHKRLTKAEMLLLRFRPHEQNRQIRRCFCRRLRAFARRRFRRRP